MRTLGIRQLKEHISEILRIVHEQGETIEVTNRGEVIALVVPVRKTQHPSSDDDNAAWADLDRLAAEIGARWPKDVSAVDAIRDVRE
ncbi:MAG: type II toxin-antitoxin system prevent-host-death family antitoxin [Chloroflexota bacterium]|nr:type II toxin-antitoxin system prevent-host-death family antitoxin [Chloroflexota bacterium]